MHHTSIPSANWIDPIAIAKLSELQDRQPAHALVENTDLVIIRYDDRLSVLYGRCLHRGALLADGFVDEQDNLICGLHHWDYRITTGVSEYNNSEILFKFDSRIEGDSVMIDRAQIVAFEEMNPPAQKREEYLGAYQDTHPENTEPFTRYIRDLARDGLSKHGHHGPTASMGVDRNELPCWEEMQYLPAQLHRPPLLDDEPVRTETIIGPKAKRPMVLSMPIFVSDMSFGALSREAKLALAKGAQLVGTGICSGEGGMLPDEQASNENYLYELASGKFGFSMDKVKLSQAFHFKAGQGAKTGTGGHLPGNKVQGEIAEVRGLEPGQAAISPATFTDLRTVSDFQELISEIRLLTGGIPVGFKMAASHIEKDIDFALACGVDYIILDGRGGGTGAAPTVLRNNINVPTIPALARARRHLDRCKAEGVSLVITGGLRIAEDFAKAMMLGADAVAIANSAMQAVGCVGMRACHTNNCPVGVATQKGHLRARLDVDKSAQQLANFLSASNDLLKVIARACGYHDLAHFKFDDLSTFDYKIHQLTGISYAGHTPSV